ncbi:UDP-N-acetylenolpyruvoylglucosamine reductase [Thermotoga maritima MSB8]|uniref:UDP-N-acetylenolpyruvoylglucosamine reductase n=2 Tax=Thermotoga maritima TaxID=2336 RepID=MURB_THEMA|nr:RecName: Full=UDP-N-acetylenolpyruvoylglucosamine reductase; AltName: Full=UDP-N-acetylmuramate dehydrogenase [Thermotoga maritima MSB8]AAD36780.1 UDP-N-acetylenolpyruvoylglucosamine reductase [Thermotoga maritima MSB8]AHD18391.1 UDP-N-acetylenolpyruvoylglucosamine reductase [Thermotoga maritima MSB8]
MFEKLSCHTSIKIGGRVKYLVLPNDVFSLERAITVLKDLPFQIMGLGTNLLVQDEDLDIAVLKTERLNQIEIKGEKVLVESGTPLKRLCLFLMEAELGGLEFAYGIPGSVGGAIYMNAGAYGGEIGEFVEAVEVLRDGEKTWLSRNEIFFGYRDSTFKREKLIITRVMMSFKKEKKETIKAKMDDYMRRRLEKQPLDLPSAGSVFKRPREDFYVGKAIESLGLKGYRIGGAQISEKHAGFIVNAGSATFDDVMKLIDFVRKKVKEKYGVELETEVEIWWNGRRW